MLKTLRLEDYHLYEDKYWRVHMLLMVNHQTGKETDLSYADYEFKVALSDRDFDKSVLQRGRR